MSTAQDPILESVGISRLGSPKALLSNKTGPMLKEFQDFAMRGNMLDMAVGIIIGAAFGRVVSSFVSDILMPPIGLIRGHSDFSTKFINLSGHAYATLAEAKAAGAATINYGAFLNAGFDFLIVAFTVFMLIRQINRLKSKENPPARTTRDCPFCMSAIALKASRCPHCTSELKMVWAYESNMAQLAVPIWFVPTALFQIWPTVACEWSLSPSAKLTEHDASEAETPESIERDLTLLGLLGIHDPPRPEVRESIAACRGAGIRVAIPGMPLGQDQSIDFFKVN